MPKITFLGAAQCVTGSKFLVEAGGKRLLVDCGLFQGGKELRERNWQPLPIPPASIDAVVLTHAHIDHTGYLPRLVSDGYAGSIYCNAATRDLCNLLLPDSAHLQEEDAEFANQKHFSKHAPALPLYTVEQAHRTLQRFRVLPEHGASKLAGNFSVRFCEAGHILGSSSIELTVNENGSSRVVLFSGDVGRYDQPILKDPDVPPRADFLVCESTYGDRDHPAESPYDALAQAVTRVVQRGGCVVIPAFAVGRTQTLLYVLRQLEDWHRIPKVPLYVDSPMAIDVTGLYLSYQKDHDAEFLRQAAAFPEKDPMNAGEVHMTRTREESRQINNINSPCIIISASGMVTGGRILHHLVRRLPDSRNAVLLAGFQAEGTRGRALLEGARTLRIHGDDVPVKAEVVHLSQFSAHAGRSELLRWLAGLPAPPKQTFLVHGEPQPSKALGEAITSQMGWNVTLPQLGQSFPL